MRKLPDHPHQPLFRVSHSPRRRRFDDRGSIFAALFSGILLTLSFPKFSLAPLAWIALVPLLVVIPEGSPKAAFRLGFFAGFVHAATCLYWIANVIDHYGGLPLPAALAILALLCAYLALYPAVFAAFASLLKRRPALWLWGTAPVWVTSEWIRAHLITGFPWIHLGYTQTPFFLLLQTADLAGVYGVGWLVMQTNTVAAGVMTGRLKARTLLIPGLCLMLALAYGSWRLRELQAEAAPFPPIRAGVVQGNIDQSIKWDPAIQEETLKRYHELSRQALKKGPLDLIVWPETAVPFFYRVEERRVPRMEPIVNDLQVPVLFGMPGVVRDGTKIRLQNMALLMVPEKGVAGAYAKRHLVPFGEYVPLKRILFFIQKLVAAAGDFVPGDRPAAFPLDSLRIGVLICYEAIFPELSRDETTHGANLLVNLTNDAWFGRSSAPYQHLEIARWRAVEYRVPLIRCANTGISAVFDATGRVLDLLPLDTTGALTVTVIPRTSRTFYGTAGDVFAWLCALTTVLLGVYGAWDTLRAPPGKL